MQKYLIIGSGGTGMPIGAFLARAGKDVTFIARGENLKAMKSSGVKITGIQDEFTIAPVNVTELDNFNGKADVIFCLCQGIFSCFHNSSDAENSR